MAKQVVNGEIVEVEEKETAPQGEESPEYQGDIPAGDDDGDDADEVKPFWLQDDDATSEGGDGDDDEGGGDVPIAAHVKLKKKLKTKLTDANAELERLRQENEQLRKGTVQHDPAKALDFQNPPKRPRSSDFETDDEYEAALDNYEQEKTAWQLKFIGQTHQQTEKLQNRAKLIDQSVDQHYDRAAKLVEQFKIDPEVYRQSTENVISIFDEVMPKAGETVFKEFVNLLGDGSEKTMFHVGRNKAAREQLTNLLRNDPTGLQAAIYLGRTQEKISGAKHQSSRAPAPGAKIQGDSASNAKGSAAYRKWQEAHKKGKLQEAYNIKKKAKGEGIDTRTWR